MLKLLKLLTSQLSGNFSSDDLAINDIAETKKCMNCLQRAELHWIRCPYCRHSGFHFNDN